MTGATQGRARGAALLVALLSVGLQLSASLHFLLIEHGHCAEHGGLEHTDDARHAVAHARAPQPEAAAAASFRAAPKVGAAEHEHCPVSSRSRADVTAPPPQAVQLPAVRLAAAKLQREAFAPLPALASAPKTSPPA